MINIYGNSDDDSNWLKLFGKNFNIKQAFTPRGRLLSRGTEVTEEMIRAQEDEAIEERRYKQWKKSQSAID